MRDLFSNLDKVRQYLREALDACRDDDKSRLQEHSPSLYALSLVDINSILLDYHIVAISRVPTTTQESLPPEKRTKPVRQTFQAIVRVAVCDRPFQPLSQKESLQLLNATRREETKVYECKEFEDGDWILMDAALSWRQLR